MSIFFILVWTYSNHSSSKRLNLLYPATFKHVVFIQPLVIKSNFNQLVHVTLQLKVKDRINKFNRQLGYARTHEPKSFKRIQIASKRCIQFQFTQEVSVTSRLLQSTINQLGDATTHEPNSFNMSIEIKRSTKLATLAINDIIEENSTSTMTAIDESI